MNAQMMFPRFINVVSLKKRLVMLAWTMALVTTCGVVTGYAQEEPHDPVNELIFQNRLLRGFVTQEMAEASELFFNEIPIQGNNQAVLSRNDILAIGSNVANVNQLKLEDLENGANIDLIFFTSSRAQPFVPHGFYLVKATLISKRTWRAKVELIDQTGNVAATLPLFIVPGPAITGPSADTLPVHTLALGVNSLTFGTNWNTGSRKSLNLFYTVPLEANN